MIVTISGGTSIFKVTGSKPEWWEIFSFISSTLIFNKVAKRATTSGDTGSKDGNNSTVKAGRLFTNCTPLRS